MRHCRPSQETWLKEATYHEGSWWIGWAVWIAGHGGGQVPSSQPGGGKLAAIEDAPGSYSVKVRAAAAGLFGRSLPRASLAVAMEQNRWLCAAQLSPL